MAAIAEEIVIDDDDQEIIIEDVEVDKQAVLDAFRQHILKEAVSNAFFAHSNTINATQPVECIINKMNMVFYRMALEEHRIDQCAARKDCRSQRLNHGHSGYVRRLTEDVEDLLWELGQQKAVMINGSPRKKAFFAMACTTAAMVDSFLSAAKGEMIKRGMLQEDEDEEEEEVKDAPSTSTAAVPKEEKKDAPDANRSKVIDEITLD